MITPRRRRLLAVVAAVAALTLSACSNPTSDDSSSSSSPEDTVTVGSAAFAESEIVAEIYAQALEAKGVTVKRKMQIGAREVYLPSLEGGEIDLIPEYTGNLLTFYKPKATVSSPSDVEAALKKALPSQLEILDPASAEDKDSLNVTQAFSTKNGVTSIADLAKVKNLTLGANPEFKTRSYGIPGLKTLYGIDGITFKPINDSGGPLTVKALLDGDVDVADIYSTTPAITANKFVTLKDPKSLIAAQNVVPLIRKSKAENAKVVDALDAVSKELTTADLLKMNTESSGAKKLSAAQIAKQWLTDKGLN